MALGKLPVPGRPTILITVGQGPTALAVGAGGGCLDIFTLLYPFFPLSPFLWETARYRLKYRLKGPLKPKPTNQPMWNQITFCPFDVALQCLLSHRLPTCYKKRLIQQTFFEHWIVETSRRRDNDCKVSMV